MAKELNPGAVLNGVSEPVRVSVSQPDENQTAYNLIVADFSTYFVGETGVLVHDNSPVRPTASVVPGIAKMNE
jgi:hypothetical protein